MMPRRSTDRALALVALGLIIVGCFLVLRPFLTAILWAAILTITLFPLYERLQAWLSPVFASLLAVTLIALGMIAPFAIVGFEIADNAERLAAWIRANQSWMPGCRTRAASILLSNPVTSAEPALSFASFPRTGSRCTTLSVLDLSTTQALKFSRP